MSRLKSLKNRISNINFKGYIIEVNKECIQVRLFEIDDILVKIKKEKLRMGPYQLGTVIHIQKNKKTNRIEIMYNNEVYIQEDLDAAYIRGKELAKNLKII